jgi:hypothetical protein
VNSAIQSAALHLLYRATALEGETTRTGFVREKEYDHEFAWLRYLLFSTIILIPMVNVP